MEDGAEENDGNIDRFNLMNLRRQQPEKKFDGGANEKGGEEET